MNDTLGDKLPEEQARCRELLGVYKEIGKPGMFAAAMIERALQRADKAVIKGDIMRMLESYWELKEFKE